MKQSSPPSLTMLTVINLTSLLSFLLSVSNCRDNRSTFPILHQLTFTYHCVKCFEYTISFDLFNSLWHRQKMSLPFYGRNQSSQSLTDLGLERAVEDGFWWTPLYPSLLELWGHSLTPLLGKGSSTPWGHLPRHTWCPKHLRWESPF